MSGRLPRQKQLSGSRTHKADQSIDQMVEAFVVELEGAVEALVKSRLREVVQSIYPGAAEFRAALGLPSGPILTTAPTVVSAGRAVTGEPTRTRPGRCVGVIAGGRRCGRAAPPGDPPMCSFCRATVALVGGATARVSISVTPPEPGDPAVRTAPIQISPPAAIIDPIMSASRKERCKGVLLGGGSCRSRVMPPQELCQWCKALGVRAVAQEPAASAATATNGVG